MKTILYLFACLMEAQELGATQLELIIGEEISEEACVQPHLLHPWGFLKKRVDFQPPYGLNPWGDMPWNDDGMNARVRTYLMSRAVWQHHMNLKDDQATAKVMLALLQQSSLQTERALLISDIWNHQWCPDAEPVLLGIAKNNEEDIGIRSSSVSALLSRCDINTYMPLAVEIILSHQEGDRCQAFGFTINQGNRLFSLSDQNKRKVLAAGFDIITKLPGENIQNGYFVARRLGFILGEAKEFAPIEEEYQGKHGPTDELFINTVKNAINWYKQHENEIKSN